MAKPLPHANIMCHNHSAYHMLNSHYVNFDDVNFAAIFSHATFNIECKIMRTQNRTSWVESPVFQMLTVHRLVHMKKKSATIIVSILNTLAT